MADPKDKKAKSPDKAKIALSKEETDRVKAWILEKAPNLKCPICRHEKFDLATHELAPPSIKEGGGFWFGGPVYPVIPLTCFNCGHTLYFNSVIMGVRDKGESNNDA